MVLYVLLAAVVVFTLVTIGHPTSRRIWVFALYGGKYLALWIADVLGIRRLAAAGLRRPYQPTSGAELMRLCCEDLGPTFIKFGQIVASSSGVFPDGYVREFAKCLDRVRPFPFAEVERIVRAELGDERAQWVASIDPASLASASIAQVHEARLKDGTKVVVKVQRPGIEQRVAADMRILRALAVIAAKVSRNAAMANPVAIVQDFAQSLGEELDFRGEAKNLDRFNEIMTQLGHRTIRAPVPHWELTTSRVLIMERFVGVRVDDVAAMQARGIDGEEALIRGIRAWFQSVILYGFFHGDVHAGNLMVLDNDDLGFLDFGIVGRFSAEERRQVTDYVVAFATGDYRGLARTIVAMGGAPASLDLDGFAADLRQVYEPLLPKSFAEINYAEILPAVQRVARRHRLVLPREFVLITKQMVYFDRYAKLLAPGLNVFQDPRLAAGLMQDIHRARTAHAPSASAGSGLGAGS